MAKIAGARNESMLDFEGIETETSELFKSYVRSTVVFTSGSEAVSAVSRQLERLAHDHGMTPDELIQQAHATRNSEPFHIEALSLVRQLALLRR
jgi:hypothetical protein